MSILFCQIIDLFAYKRYYAIIGLKELRTEKLTQKAVANCLGINLQVYSWYAREERQADYETLIKLANLFGVTLDYLFGLETG